MEGTATWIEDEVYPAVDDNFQYLRTSPLSASDFWLPLDVWEPRAGRAGSGHEYGAWVFWRYLSERFGRNVVRAVLRRARGAPYAIQATVAELAARGTPFATLLGDFAVANFLSATSYRRGASYASRPGVGPKPSRTFQLTAGAPDTGRRVAAVPHMASDYYAFTPAADLPPGSRLTVEVDLPGAETSPRATLLVLKQGGVVERTAIALDGNGVGSVTTAELAGGSVTGAVLVLTNASTRFTGCGRDRRPPFVSCLGTPLDDAEYSFRAFAAP